MMVKTIICMRLRRDWRLRSRLRARGRRGGRCRRRGGRRERIPSRTLRCLGPRVCCCPRRARLARHPPLWLRRLRCRLTRRTTRWKRYWWRRRPRRGLLDRGRRHPRERRCLWMTRMRMIWRKCLCCRSSRGRWSSLSGVHLLRYYRREHRPRPHLRRYWRNVRRIALRRLQFPRLTTNPQKRTSWKHRHIHPCKTRLRLHLARRIKVPRCPKRAIRLTTRTRPCPGTGSHLLSPVARAANRWQCRRLQTGGTRRTRWTHTPKRVSSRGSSPRCGGRTSSPCAGRSTTRSGSCTSSAKQRCGTRRTSRSR